MMPGLFYTLAVRFTPANSADVSLNSPFEGVDEMITDAYFSKINESSNALKMSILSKLHQPSSSSSPMPTLLSIKTEVRFPPTLGTLRWIG